MDQQGGNPSWPGSFDPSAFGHNFGNQPMQSTNDEHGTYAGFDVPMSGSSWEGPDNVIPQQQQPYSSATPNHAFHQHIGQQPQFSAASQPTSNPYYMTESNDNPSSRESSSWSGYSQYQLQPSATPNPSFDRHGYYPPASQNPVADANHQNPLASQPSGQNLSMYDMTRGSNGAPGPSIYTGAQNVDSQSWQQHQGLSQYHNNGYAYTDPALMQHRTDSPSQTQFSPATQQPTQTLQRPLPQQRIVSSSGWQNTSQGPASSTNPRTANEPLNAYGQQAASNHAWDHQPHLPSSQARFEVASDTPAATNTPPTSQFQSHFGQAYTPAVPTSAAPQQVVPRPPKAAKSIAKSLTSEAPREIEHLRQAKLKHGNYKEFPGVPNLVLGETVNREAGSKVGEPALLLDSSKDLGRRFFQNHNKLPAEVIADFVQRAPKDPERIPAWRAECRQELKKECNKDLNTKVYKQFASKQKTPEGGKATSVDSHGAVAADSPSSIGEDEDDDSGSSDEEDEEIRSPNPPKDPTDLAAWESIGHVCVGRDPSSIKQAVKNFGDFVKGIYDSIKEVKERQKLAQGNQVDGLKKELVFHQERLFRAVDAAYKKGYDQVLENLGGNGPLVANLVAALRDCVNASDLAGKLPKALLRLMSQFVTVTDETLYTRLKFDKIQKRFVKGGDDEVRELVNTVQANTVDSRERQSGTKANKDLENAPASGPSATPKVHAPLKPTAAAGQLGAKKTEASASKAPIRVPSDSSPAKRPRDDDTDSRVTKKLATNSANGTPQPAAKLPAAKSAVATAGPTSATQHKSWSSTGLLPGKSRPSIKPPVKSETAKAEPPKPVAPIKVESKRDHIKSDALKADAIKIKKPTSKIESSQSSVSKLGALLEEIAKPKAAPPPPPTPELSIDAPETPEEKAKRLRKESRRKLRVSWKEGDALTEVRVFEKDVAEDEGRAQNLIRDARDDRSEGMALKQSLRKTADLEEEDDELPYRPWVEPTPINVSTLPQDKRDKTYVTRAGILEVHTEEQRAMQERENTVLMAIYTDPSDIPPTPKSPLPAQNAFAQPSAQGVYLPANDAKFSEIHLRWNEERTQGTWGSLRSALQRAEKSRPTRGNAIGQSSAAATSTADEVLRLLGSDKVKNWTPRDPFDPAHPKTQRRYDYPDPAVQKAADAIEEVAAKLKGKPFPPTEPPDYIKDPDRHREWWEGFNRHRQRAQQETAKETATRVAAPSQPASQTASQGGQQDYTAAWAAYYAQLNQGQNQDASAAPQQQQPYGQYYNGYYQQQGQAGQAAAAIQQDGDSNTQLQALLATLGGTQGSTQQNSIAGPQNDPRVQALLAAVAGTGQPAPQYQGQPASNAQNPNDPAYQAYMLSVAQWAAANQQQPGAGDQSASGPSDQSALNQGYGDSQHHQQQDAHRSGPNTRSHGRNKRETRETRESQDSSTPNHLRGINRALIGTKPCVFWKSGKCAKGDKCTFRHD